MHPLTQSLRAAMKADKAEKEKPKTPGVVLDSVLDADADDDAASYALTNIAVLVAAALQEWVETADDDLDEGESLADRLLATLIGIADPDQDDEEMDDDEQAVLNLALEAAWDYLTDKGVSEDDADKLLNDWDPDAAGRIRDLLVSILPDGDDAAAEDIDSFAFDGDDDDGSVKLDAVYKMKTAVRNGKRVRIRKRMSGKVKLSAKQKLAIRKAQKKAHTAGAMMRRLKSLRNEGLAK
ncbi:hypothetical protein [Cupriavidus basilensis]|uniref:Baseplate or tail tube n=1 Tax=Cupriavidus basilensis TaxID=68895 RepID=A0A0C4YDL3_9BURK|nr:hypothetical protein [Cupriavidus basilensis]AJG18846.1 baseplate or tail tube [Cupriavidus basilensis]